MLNSYRLIESTRYQIPDNLCFTSDKPLKDVKQMIYDVLYVGLKLKMEAITRRDFDIGASIEPLGESVCYLLQEFYEVTLHPYENFSIPIDLYCLWNWSDPDVDKRNGHWIDEKEYFVPGLAERVTQILRGDIVPYKMSDFPWSEGESTPLEIHELGETGELQHV